jgi:hypothetical protein
MQTEVVAALIQALPSTLIGLLGFVLTRQNLENSWRQTLDSISREFWKSPDIQRIRCAVAYRKAYSDLKYCLIKRRKINAGIRESSEEEVDLEQEEYEILDNLDKFLTLLESAALSSPILREKTTVWNALYFDYWLQKCMEKEELKWYIDNYFPRLSKFYGKKSKGR